MKQSSPFGPEGFDHLGTPATLPGGFEPPLQGTLALSPQHCVAQIFRAEHENPVSFRLSRLTGLDDRSMGPGRFELPISAILNHLVRQGSAHNVRRPNQLDHGPIHYCFLNNDYLNMGRAGFPELASEIFAKQVY